MVEQPLQVTGNLLNDLIGHQFIQFILMLVSGPHPKSNESDMHRSQCLHSARGWIPLCSDCPAHIFTSSIVLLAWHVLASTPGPVAKQGLVPLMFTHWMPGGAGPEKLQAGGKGPNLYTVSKRPHFLLAHLSLTVLLWSPPCPQVASWDRRACADVPTNLGRWKDYRAFTLNAPSFVKTY